LDLAGHHILNRDAAAFVGNVHQIEPGPCLEPLRNQMRRCADPRRGIAELARIGPA
jgi:hypothetical protein